MGFVVYHISLDSFKSIVESHLPTRPSSDHRRQLSARNRPTAAMETQYHVFPGLSERNKQRSSSFSALSQSIPRPMPSNRPEKGGTTGPLNNESKSGNSSIHTKMSYRDIWHEGRANEREDLGEADRRNQSWSPKKIAKIIDERDGQGLRDKQVE